MGFWGFFRLRRWVVCFGFCAGIRVTVFALALASAYCLRASSVAPVRVFVWRLRGASVAVVCLPLRWHPRYGVCRSSVAPVRGGTYFSLPPQRKVGKRKRLTPPALDVCPRAPNVP